MNIILIEDEKLVSDDLAAILRSLSNHIHISQALGSVQEAVSYFSNNEMPDLIFSDIQLGDGYSFEIFSQFEKSAPVIFCTAYDQHALQAFSSNGIAYVLKPYTKKTIRDALEKYTSLKRSFTGFTTSDVENLIRKANGEQSKPQSLLINHKNKIIPIKITDAAFFTIEQKSTLLVTRQKQQFTVNHTLDELEEICGEDFFRANRQFLINKASVQEVQHYNLRKLFVQLSVKAPGDVVVNKTRAAGFLNWLRS